MTTTATDGRNNVGLPIARPLKQWAKNSKLK